VKLTTYVLVQVGDELLGICYGELSIVSVLPSWNVRPGKGRWKWYHYASCGSAEKDRSTRSD
jgi:hypothetical protein